MTDRPSGRWSRRTLLRTGGGAAAAFGLGAGAAVAAPRLLPDPSSPSAAGDLEPFYGPHQAGIVSGRQSSAAFAAFTLRPEVRVADARRMMRLVTDDAARLTQARPALGDQEPDLARHAARLTVTFGFSPDFFAKLGLDAARPAGLVELPAYPVDRLQARFSGGDVLAQIGADDPMVVAHALRQLTKTFRTFADRRWVQRGFTSPDPTGSPERQRGRSHGGPGGSSPQPILVRNLMGLVDGSANPRPAEPDFESLVWSTGSPAWFAGGTTLVLRRIAMTLSTWDELDTTAKELAVGRRIATGAPLSGQLESDEPDLAAVDGNGLPLIPAFSHVAQARARTPEERFLRRSYSYDDGQADDEDTGTGLLFASYQADVRRQFLPVQERLAANDAMNAWTVPIGSAVFALPPGCAPGGYVGEGLLS